MAWCWIAKFSAASSKDAIVNLYCADHVGAFTEGGGEAHRRFRKMRVKEYLEERTGIKNISLVMCDARNGQMPGFKGIECGLRGYSTMNIETFLMGYLLQRAYP